MSTSLDEAMQDAHEQEYGREAQLACEDCGESCVVIVDDTGLTDDQCKCRVCGGWGAEV